VSEKGMVKKRQSVGAQSAYESKGQNHKMKGNLGLVGSVDSNLEADSDEEGNSMNIFSNASIKKIGIVLVIAISINGSPL
jgi:hypothetical protein